MSGPILSCRILSLSEDVTLGKAKQRCLKQTKKMALLTELGNLVLCSAKALHISERRYEPCLHTQVCPMSLEITVGSLIFLSWHVSA